MERIKLCLLFIILMTSCLISSEPKYPARYGVEFNPTRKALGISLLKEDWTATYVSNTITAWGPLNGKKGESYHASKSICYYNGTLGWEIDTFFGNKKYQTEDGTSYEYLTVSYYYISSKYNKNIPPTGYPEYNVVGFICDYTHLHENSFSEIRDLITKSQADSILISWGLGDEIVPLSIEK